MPERSITINLTMFRVLPAISFRRLFVITSNRIILELSYMITGSLSRTIRKTSYMIIVHYQAHQKSRNSFRPTLLDEQIIKLRRPRFDSVLDGLKCGYSEHSDFQNVITINVSAAECFDIERVCCREFEERISNALTETCKNRNA